MNAQLLDAIEDIVDALEVKAMDWPGALRSDLLQSTTELLALCQKAQAR